VHLPLGEDASTEEGKYRVRQERTVTDPEPGILKLITKKQQRYFIAQLTLRNGVKVLM
jgi:hypothetical protein